MRDEFPDDKPKSINRRNLVMVLGGVGALLLIANVGERDFGFFDGDDDRSGVIIIDDDDKADRIEAAIEQNVEGRVEAAVEAVVGDDVDDDEMDAAVEELRKGDADRFNKLMDKYRAAQ